MKVCAFIDGFNLFHAIDAVPNLRKYKWLDLKKLANLFLPAKDQLIDVYYFSALATWDPAKVAKHNLYIEALKSVGVKIILGTFRFKDVYCYHCKKTSKTHQEKETDVNIAIRLFQTAITNDYEKALIISGDSDLLPSIRAVKQTFPTKQIEIIIPIARRAELLKQESDAHHKMKDMHLSSAQFPDKITLPSGKVIGRPTSWI